MSAVIIEETPRGNDPYKSTKSRCPDLKHVGVVATETLAEGTAILFFILDTSKSKGLPKYARELKSLWLF